VVELRPLDLTPGGIRDTCELLNAVYPHADHIDPAYLERLYFGNPLGETSGISAWLEGRLVAHYLMIPVKARIRGEEELGIWPFQLATHPEYQGKGLFTSLHDAAIAQCREKGFGFFSGVGNAQSSPIFVRKWDVQAVRRLDVKVGLGPVPPPRQVGPGELDFVRVWDAAGLAWRISVAQPPYTVQHRRGRGTLFANAGRYAIRASLGSYPSEWIPVQTGRLVSANPVRLWMGLDPTRNWRYSLYFNLPERLRPSPLILLFSDLTDENRQLDPAKVRFDAFDFDAF
jgi:GNAT superfamily N-acetyltransferase